jgi:hypothetical protein
MVNFMELLKNNWPIVLAVVVVVISMLVYLLTSTPKKSTFKNTLITPMDQIDPTPPQMFPSLSERETGGIQLESPTVPEEIGFAMVYPQGSGVGMVKSDSNAFTPDKPGPLLTDYSIPESYGESSLADPTGANGAGEGARVLRIKSTGDQLLYKANDESVGEIFASAYTDGEVQAGSNRLINNTKYLDYNNGYNPDKNLRLQASTGQESSLSNCETWYPNTVKYKDMCITEGDIPYGQVVNNKVNPRLVSRWQSYTGDYSREEALNPIDGVLYPNLGVLVK